MTNRTHDTSPARGGQAHARRPLSAALLLGIGLFMPLSMGARDCEQVPPDCTDAAGAVVLGATENGSGVLSTKLRTDGSYVKTLYVPAGGSLNPATAETVRRNEHTITMNGKEVFKIAVRSMEEISREALAEAGVEIDQLSLVIPHQANLRIISATAKRLGMPMERVILTIREHGNTSAASVPMALDSAIRDGRVKRGDLLLLEAFGGGFTWGASLIRY